MLDNIESYSMSTNKIQDLYTQFLANVIEIDAITESINKLEKTEETDFDTLETLYRNEFFLYMEHIGIYEDLILNIDHEPQTTENEFELARIRKEAGKMLRVTVMELT